MRVGMLPRMERERVQYIGNVALTGACAAALSGAARAKLLELAQGMTYIELSTTPGYMDEFIAACFLPHTDAALFS